MLPDKLACPCNKTVLTIFKLLRFCEALTESLGNPFPGSYSILALSRATRASFWRLIDASNEPLADAVN